MIWLYDLYKPVFDERFGSWSRGLGLRIVLTPSTGPMIARTQSQSMPHGSSTLWPAATMIASEISG